MFLRRHVLVITGQPLIPIIIYLMKINKFTPPRIYRLAKYEIYCQKKQELVDFINEQIIIWGNYNDIPADVKEFIDREFVALGKFGKKIDAASLDSSGQLHIYGSKEFIEFS